MTKTRRKNTNTVAWQIRPFSSELRLELKTLASDLSLTMNATIIKLINDFLEDDTFRRRTKDFLFNASRPFFLDDSQLQIEPITIKLRDRWMRVAKREFRSYHAYEVFVAMVSTALRVTR